MKSQHVTAFAGKDDVGQRKRFENVGKSFLASLGAFGNSFEFAEIMAIECYN